MQTLRLIHEDGTEEAIEVDQALWDRFTARAEELGVPEQDLFIIALESFVKSQE